MRSSAPWSGRGAPSWEAEQQRLAHWLEGIPRPFGIMACNDIRGQHVLDACSNMQVAVPEEAAVIVVDNDHLPCRICAPLRSSVVPNAEGVGFRAAEILAQMREGHAEYMDVVFKRELGLTPGAFRRQAQPR